MDTELFSQSQQEQTVNYEAEKPEERTSWAKQIRMKPASFERSRLEYQAQV